MKDKDTEKEAKEVAKSEEVKPKLRAKPKSKRQSMNPNLVPMRKHSSGSIYHCIGVHKSQVEHYISKGWSVDGNKK